MVALYEPVSGSDLCLILVLCFRSASVEILFAYYVCAIMALVCEVLYLVRLNGVINTLQRRH